MSKRNIEIKVRLNRKEAEILNKRVKKSRLSREAYLRHLIDGVVPQDSPPPDYYSMMRELHGVANNLNQIAQEGNRPVVIIQNDIGNKHSPTVIVAAITSQNPSKGVLPTHCYLGAESGLERPSIILLEQLRTIDKRRLGHYIGRLSQKRIEKMDRALMVSLDLFCQESKTTIISLCGVCVSNFRNTGAYYLCRLDPGQIKKEVCTYCNQRRGFDYVMMKKGSDG